MQFGDITVEGPRCLQRINKSTLTTVHVSLKVRFFMEYYFLTNTDIFLSYMCFTRWPPRDTQSVNLLLVRREGKVLKDRLNRGQTPYKEFCAG